jgi:hypothetical protein
VATEFSPDIRQVCRPDKIKVDSGCRSVLSAKRGHNSSRSAFNLIIRRPQSEFSLPKFALPPNPHSFLAAAALGTTARLSAQKTPNTLKIGLAYQSPQKNAAEEAKSAATLMVLPSQTLWSGAAICCYKPP